LRELNIARRIQRGVGGRIDPHRCYGVGVRKPAVGDAQPALDNACSGRTRAAGFELDPSGDEIGQIKRGKRFDNAMLLIAVNARILDIQRCSEHGSTHGMGTGWRRQH